MRLTLCDRGRPRQRYSKRAPGTGMTAQQHLGAEMAAKQREGRGGAAAAVTPFDYGASAAERPALSGALQPQLAGDTLPAPPSHSFLDCLPASLP